MPERPSILKHRANRKNATKSTGPKTAEGKARCAQNAVKHGLLSKRVLVRKGDGAERPAEFEALVAELHADLRPVGRYEKQLVDRIAGCYWRLARAQNYEVGAIRTARDECKKERLQAGRNVKEVGSELGNRQFRLAEEERILRMLQSPTVQRGEFDQALYAGALQNAARNCTPAAEVSEPRVREAAMAESERKIARLRQEVELFRGLMEEARAYDDLADDRRPLLASIPPDAELEKLVRYETMLDGNLHCAIRALERHRARPHDPVPEPDDTSPAPSNTDPDESADRDSVPHDSGPAETGRSGSARQDPVSNDSDRGDTGPSHGA